MDRLLHCEGFDWDKGNFDKSWIKHKVSPSESEQVFFNEDLLIVEDLEHSQKEDRFYALGRTDAGRFLFISFVIRENRIRVISARNMSRQERKDYLSYEKDPSV